MPLDLLVEHHADIVLVVQFLARSASPCAHNSSVDALQPQGGEVLVSFALILRNRRSLTRHQLVCDKEVFLGELILGPSTIKLLCDAKGRSDIVFAGWHVHIDDLHGKPRHENQEGEHGEDAADRSVVVAIILICETNGLPEAVKLLQERVVRFLRHAYSLLCSIL